MDRRERVKRAISFQRPDRPPLWLFNRYQEQGDILWRDFRIQEGKACEGYHGHSRSEWGYEWRTLDDGTMGHPTLPHLPDWKAAQPFSRPPVREADRMAALPAGMDVVVIAKPGSATSDFLATDLELRRLLQSVSQ